MGFDLWYEMMIQELADRALEERAPIDDAERPCRVEEDEDGPDA